VQVCRSGLTLGSAIEIEAEPIALDATGTAFEYLDSSSNPKGAVVHIGAIGEIPDRVVRPTRKVMATQGIIAA
jgi:hypothetical protein